MAELNIAQAMRFRVDVKTGLVEQPQRESLMKGDKKANRIIAEIVNGGVPQDITGVTVKGKFCRPPDLDEVELSGTAEGNLAIVQLTDACYAQSGNYQATVSLVLDDVERTVLFISGAVLRSGSGKAAGEDAGGGSSTGSGLPSGGTAGQVLVKVTAASGDASWKTLTASDVKARPDTWMPTAEEVGALPSTTEIPTVPSVLPNPQPIVINGISYDGSEKKEITIQADGGGIVTETDPTVPDWAKNPTKPTYTASEVGALSTNGTAADSDKLGGKAPEYYLKPQNLLDNSDFRNPVNQRGKTSYTGVEGQKTYTIDRWATWQSDANGIQLTGSSIVIASGVELVQNVPIDVIKENKVYTIGAMKADGSIVTMSATAGSSTSGVSVAMAWEGNYGVSYTIYLKHGEWLWAALYEGEYAVDNLPPYVPKGYAVELAECRRYAKAIRGDIVGVAHSYLAGSAYGTIFTDGKMRTNPSIGDIASLKIINGEHYSDSFTSVTGVTNITDTENAISFWLTHDAIEAGKDYFISCKTDALFSADL